MLVRILISLLALGLLCVAYGVVVERRWYRLVRYRLHILPPGSEPLRLLHLSDLHFVRGDRGGKKGRFIEGLPDADVTVITGDVLGEPEAVEASVGVLDAVRGRLASCFVLGSNDYYAPRPLNYLAYFGPRRRRRRHAVPGRAADLVEQLRARGWEGIDNRRQRVDLAGLPVELLGLGDAHIGRQDLRVAPRRERGAFGLAVMHSPDTAPETAALGYDLIVAGHTHGGQVRFPVVGALITNSHLPRRLVSGLARMGGAIVHTSPGLGTSKYAPFRFLCRPEATLLELEPAEWPLTREDGSGSS